MTFLNHARAVRLRLSNIIGNRARRTPRERRCDPIFQPMTSFSAFPLLRLALVLVLTTASGFAANFAITATDVAPAVVLDGQRRAVLRVAVNNPVVGGPPIVQLASLGLRFENSAGAGLSTEEASNLFATIEIYRDTNGSGTLESSSDTFVSGLFSPELAADGRLSVDFADSDPTELQLPAGNTRNFFVVVQLTDDASSESPNAFRLTHLANGSGASTARDGGGVPLTLVATANVTSKLITAALNQAPTTSGVADIVVFDNSAPSTISLFPAFHDAEDEPSQMSYSVVGNTNAALFQFVGIEPATGNLLLTYATGVTGLSQLTVKATDSLGKTVTASFQVKVVPFITFSDFLSLHPGAGGPLESNLGNGQMNLLSYAFFLNQGVNGGIAGLPRLQGTGNARIFTHLRPKFASDVFYNYQLSQDMLAWQPAVKNVDYYENTKDLGDGSVRVELLLLGTWQKVFMRAQAQLVSSPPPPGVPPPPVVGENPINPPVEPAAGMPPPPPPGTGNPIQSSVMFPNQAILGTQSFATTVVAADIDNDGFKDVIAAAQNDSVSPVAWYRNNGNGTFAAKQVVTTLASGAFFVRAADLDGDGLVDIISTSVNDRKVAWYKNIVIPGTGLHTFGPQQVLTATYRYPRTVEIADLDNDGIPDILTISFVDSNVSWMHNNGNGTFGPLQIITTQSANPLSAIAADLDGDGARDIVVGSLNDHTVAWYKGNGNGTFGAKQILVNTVNAPGAVAAADMDGDGRLDVTAALAQDNKIIWFRNTGTTGSATFSSPQTIATQLAGPYAALPSDLNGDGKLDIVSASYNDYKVAWYRNLGGGNFGDSTQNQIIISANAAGAGSVASADFDHDGAIDVTSASLEDGNIAAYMNRGGQSGLTTTDVAPAYILDGQKREVLRLSVASRGQAGDDNARLASVSLLLESSPGVPLTTGQANALIENLYIYADADNSGAFEPDLDLPVAIVPWLSLNAGKLTVVVRDNAPAVQIAPGTTRSFFVVPQMTANAASQNPNTLRVTHFTQGPGHSTAKDAFSGAVLTVESSVVSSVSSSITTAQVNQSPTTIGLPNVTVYDTVSPTLIAIHNYFNDAEDGSVTLRYAISGNSNPGMFAFVGIEAGTGVLTIRYRPGIGGSSSITVKATDTLGKSVAATFQVLVSLADTFAHWSNANGGGGNLLGYAFCSKSQSGYDVAGLPKIKIQGKARVVSHLKPRWATDMTYQYEMSQDMVTWIPAIPDVHFHEFSKDLPNATRQSDFVLLVNWPKAFMRVRTSLAN